METTQKKRQFFFVSDGTLLKNKNRCNQPNKKKSFDSGHFPFFSPCASCTIYMKKSKLFPSFLFSFFFFVPSFCNNIVIGVCVRSFVCVCVLEMCVCVCVFCVEFNFSLWFLIMLCLFFCLMYRH